MANTQPSNAMKTKPKSKPRTVSDLIKSLGLPPETKAVIASVPINKAEPVRFGAKITIRYTATP